MWQPLWKELEEPEQGFTVGAVNRIWGCFLKQGYLWFLGGESQGSGHWKAFQGSGRWSTRQQPGKDKYSTFTLQLLLFKVSHRSPDCPLVKHEKCTIFGREVGISEVSCLRAQTVTEGRPFPAPPLLHNTSALWCSHGLPLPAPTPLWFLRSNHCTPLECMIKHAYLKSPSFEFKRSLKRKKQRKTTLSRITGI